LRYVIVFELILKSLILALSNTTVSRHAHCSEPDVGSLSAYNYVVPIFLSVYLLIGNVMLLNLLIAIFT
jgi:hypothetical protein